MSNNDCLRSLRYTFDINDSEMINTFSLADLTVTREQVSSWLKKEEDPDYKLIEDNELEGFLNGFIIKNRGKNDGPLPKPAKKMSNNLILKKIKIAMNLKSDEVKELLELASFPISDHELSAFFRKPGHKNFKTCQDQILRLFLKGLQLKYRPVT